MEKEKDFGEFEEIVDESLEKKEEIVDGQVVPNRVRLPRGNEKIGIIVQRLGGNRMDVQCTDGKSRNCRVPGRFKRSMWLRPRDIVLIMPWVDDDNKGDVIFHYHSGSVNQLRKRGLLNNLKSDF